MDELASISAPADAVTLLSPPRLEILREARTPRSATEIGAALGLPRQRVNYHVEALAGAGFLRRAGRRRRRNLYEQQYQASARSYVFSPEILGPVHAGIGSVEDRLSAAYLLALASQVQGDVVRVMREAAADDRRVATLSMNADVHFESAAQREAFTRALRDAVAGVIAEHTSPCGRPFRFVLGCYPQPPEDAPESDDTSDETSMS